MHCQQPGFKTSMTCDGNLFGLWKVKRDSLLVNQIKNVEDHENKNLELIWQCSISFFSNGLLIKIVYKNSWSYTKNNETRICHIFSIVMTFISLALVF